MPWSAHGVRGAAAVILLAGGSAFGGVSPEMRAFVEGMPKTALHMHLEGSFEPELAFAIAERNGIKPGSEEFPWKSVEELEDAYHFSDLESFLDVYNQVAKVLETEQDFHDLAAAYCSKAVSQNVRHAEVFFDPQTHTSRGIAFETVADGINRAFREARSDRFSVRLIASFLRDHPVGTKKDPARVDRGFPGVKAATGWATAKQVVAYNRKQAKGSVDRILGVGLDNNEVGYPPDLFAEIYAYARENGLLTTAHAGEEGPPSYVWQAIEDAHCARLDHCVRSIEDPKLVAFLATPQATPAVLAAYGEPHRIPATVCPRSNYELKVFPDPTTTNIVVMLDLGIQATVNSDDPAYFDGYATENYLFLLESLAPGVASSRPIDIADVYRLCVNGFEASWLSPEEKSGLLKEVNEYFTVSPGTLYTEVDRDYGQSPAAGLAIDADPVRHGPAGSGTASAAEPPLPRIDWASIGEKASVIVPGRGMGDDPLPPADVVVLTWTNAEWAALAHVFGPGDREMPYRYYDDEGWQKGWAFYRRGFSEVASGLPSGAPSLANGAWGRYCLARFEDAGVTALLFKSDMHITTDGPAIPLQELVARIIGESAPKLILTIGTAGGARVQDVLGAVNVTSAARFDLSDEFASLPFNHKTFRSAWVAPDPGAVRPLLMEPPVTLDRLEQLAAKLPGYRLKQLMNGTIEPGRLEPKVNRLDAPVLTSNGYDVANTDGNYDRYAALEMDDAVVAMVANGHGTDFGIARNISDPVQNADLPDDVQAAWGQAIYEEYGLYSSFNGALVASAIIRRTAYR